MVFSEALKYRRGGLAAWLVLPWMLCVVGGFVTLWVHAARQGSLGGPISQWPAESTLPLHADLPTLVVFIHPECPCSRATLDHLRPLAERGDTSIVLVTMTPPVSESTLPRGVGCHQQIASLAESLNVVRIDDVGGGEAKRFEVTTSGTCFLFTPDSRSVFQGGVTSGRGHRGANAGLRMMSDRIGGKSHSAAAHPVFGCSLENETPSESPSETPSETPSVSPSVSP